MEMKPLQRIARYVLLANSFLMVLYGIVVVFQPDLFTDNLEIYSGLTMEELARTQERLATYIDRIVQLNGAFNFLLGLVGFLAVYRSFRSREPWLLMIIFIATILGYLAPMTFDQITGVLRYPEIIEIFVFVLSAAALLIIRPEFQKNTS